MGRLKQRCARAEEAWPSSSLSFLPHFCYNRQDATEAFSLPVKAQACTLDRLFHRSQDRSIMAKAMWNGQLLAESETFETVEGNIYFPEETVKREFLRPSSTTSTCPWKGQARYYTLLVDGQENPDAAWYYPDPKPAARNVKHHIAFWRGVEIIR
jgi:uncharacterized protein (DUF427 family)